MKNWIRRKLIAWLGIDKIHEAQKADALRLDGHDRVLRESRAIAVDASVMMKDSSWIVIASKLHGGQVRIIECPPTDLVKLRDIVARIVTETGGIRRDLMTYDAPREMQRIMREWQ